MKKKSLIAALLGVSIISLATLSACSSTAKTNSRSYTIGVAGTAEQKEWTQVAKDVKAEGITLNVKIFNEYTQLNPSLKDGSLDLNAFQHTAFLENWNKENKGDLVSIGYSYLSPFGLYSKKITDYKALKDGDTIALPNDPVNEGRALQLLDTIGIIKLKANAPQSPAVKDIETYVKKVTIKPIQGDQIAAALPDVTAACINTNFVQDQLHETPDAALYVDTSQMAKVSSLYKNIVVVKKTDKDKSDFKKLVKAYQTEEIAKIIKEGGDIPAW